MEFMRGCRKPRSALSGYIDQIADEGVWPLHDNYRLCMHLLCKETRPSSGSDLGADQDEGVLNLWRGVLPGGAPLL